jgi:hypothetical protein
MVLGEILLGEEPPQTIITSHPDVPPHKLVYLLTNIIKAFQDEKVNNVDMRDIMNAEIAE